MSTTAELIVQVKRRLLEESGTSFTDAHIVDALNEAYQHMYGMIVDLDPAGEIFADEEDVTYSASSSLVLWSAILAKSLVKLHALEELSGTQADPIPLVNRQRAQTRSRRWSDLVGVPSRSGLRLYQEGVPPTYDVELRVFYTPAPTEMDTAAPAVEPPFLVECYSTLAAYATVVLLMDAETPTSGQQQRFDMLENDVRAATARAVQTQSTAEVGVVDPTLYDCFD